jgi:hypothetical protein
MRARRKVRWRDVVYVARYAHQPFPVVLGLTVQEFADVMEAISGIIDMEAKAGRG